MKQAGSHKAAWIFVGILSVMNIALILYLFLDPAGTPAGAIPTEGQQEEQIIRFFQRRMSLDEQQQQEFRHAWETFHNTNKDVQQELMALRNQLHEELVSKTRDQTLMDSLSLRMASLVAERERMLAAHFDHLMSVCTPSQQKTLRKVFQQMIRPGPAPGRPPGPPPGGPEGHRPPPGFPGPE